MGDPYRLVSKVTNTNTFANDEKFIGKVVYRIRGSLKRDLTSPQIMEIVEFVGGLSEKAMRSIPIMKLENALVDRFIDKYRTASCVTKRPDIREILKSQIGYNSEDNSKKAVNSFSYNKDMDLFGGASPYDVQRYFNPQALVAKTAILLDSKYRKLESGGTDFYAWDMVEGLSRTQGSFNTTTKIRDITHIKIFKLRMPYVSSAENDLGRVSILIDEFSSQAVIAQENRKYHFIGEIAASGDFYEVIFDQFGQGVWEFAKPVTTFSMLSLYFASPIEPITFDDDRTTCVLDPDTVYTTTPTITTSIPHNINTGNRVYLSGFTTATPTTDAYLIQALNNKYYPVVKTSATTLQITGLNDPSVNISSVMKTTSGTVSITSGTNTITGVNTAFTTDLNINGSYVQYVYLTTDGKTFEKAELTTAGLTDTSITLAGNVASTYTNGFLYYNTTYPAKNFSIYFDSKRILIHMEISFITSQSD